MSERLSAEERQQQREARLDRLESLQPVLLELASQAKATYGLLRPLARHVGTVPRDFPLRHQQIHGLGVSGPTGIVADYLMIAFGNHHDVLLYQDFSESRHRPDWKFERSMPISDTHFVRSSFPQNLSPNYLPKGCTIGPEISRYRYGNPKGTNDMHDGFVSCYVDNYSEAERYIEEFVDDLTEAVRRFGPEAIDPAAS